MREGCFSFFYNLANAIGTEFEPIFDKLIDFTLKYAASEEGVNIEGGKKEGDFSLGSASDDEDEELIDDSDEGDA